MADSVTIYEALRAVQLELKAPKSQRNTFGNYNYRNCEDILEAVKPLLDKHGLVLVINDQLEAIGDRYYVKATATVTDNGDQVLYATAYAREEETKKGMDGSQITGAASSYARKIALNGLFLIDDTKDADSDEHRKTTQSSKPQPAPASKTPQQHVKEVFSEPSPATPDEPTTEQLEAIRTLRAELGYPAAQTETKLKLVTTYKAAEASIAKLKAEKEEA